MILTLCSKLNEIVFAGRIHNAVIKPRYCLLSRRQIEGKEATVGGRDKRREGRTSG